MLQKASVVYGMILKKIKQQTLYGVSAAFFSNPAACEINRIP